MMKSIRFRIASILLAIIVLLSVSFGTISTLVIKSGADEIFWIIILTVVYCLVGVVVSFWIGGKIAKPISICADRLYALSEGDLKSPVPQIHTKDETGRLADATEVIVSNLRAIISDLVSLLEALSRSNFNVRSQAQDAYRGDFKPLSDHFERIVLSLNDTLSQINQSAGMVSNESEQVSYGAQNLAQGASEQTASIEELAAAIHHLSDKVKENALNAVQAGEWATQTMGEVGQCNDKMQSMVQAMKRIEQTSSQISNIVKAIEDIAFQTNILALNAGRLQNGGRSAGCPAGRDKEHGRNAERAPRDCGGHRRAVHCGRSPDDGNGSDFCGGADQLCHGGRKRGSERGAFQPGPDDEIAGVSVPASLFLFCTGQKYQSVISRKTAIRF